MLVVDVLLEISREEIWLGDVLVSKGLVQYDLGQKISRGYPHKYSTYMDSITYSGVYYANRI